MERPYCSVIMSFVSDFTAYEAPLETNEKCSSSWTNPCKMIFRAKTLSVYKSSFNKLIPSSLKLVLVLEKSD